MGFVIGLLNFVGFIFYIVAAIAAFGVLIGFMSNDSKDGAGIKGGFIAPLEKKQTIVPTSYIKGNSSTLSIFGIEISKTTSSYADFCKEMKKMENAFVESLKQSDLRVE